jgi:S1-C subfamily serine protease
MRHVIAVSLVFVGVSAVPVRADTSLPVKTLNEIKDAAVFVRVEKDKVVDASGSGFLVRVIGDTGYVVTNHHVVNLTVTVERKVAVLVAPRPGTPITPGRPTPGKLPAPGRPTAPRPTTEYRTEKVEIAVPAPNITLVFGSGTKQERSMPAEVVASDPVLDLAVLKVKGMTDLPKPINIKSPEIRETMTVFIFGYPFGKGLAIGKGSNPAITVNRASVSSIRAAQDGNVRLIQVDGSINPGNSGGPLVDENGQLVGIAVAHIRNTTIGLAIPGDDLQLVLAGYAARPKLVPGKVEKDMLEVQAEVDVVDPFEKVKSVVLYYVPTSAVTDAAKKDGLAKLAETKKIELKREKLKATGTISMAVPEKASFDFTCQVAYVNEEGKTIMGQLTASALKTPAPKVEKPKLEAKRPDPQPQQDKPTVNAPIPVLKFDGERGALVGVSLKPLAKGKLLTDNELTGILDDLQVTQKAPGAVKRLLNAQPDPKRQSEVARLVEKIAANNETAVFTRADAATALRSWGTPESVETLAALVNDPNVHSIHYRHPAMWSLAYLGGDKAIAAIATRIENNIDRGAVVQMLQGMGSAAEAQAIVLLEHKSDAVRQDAAKILKSVGTKASADVLTKAAEGDKNEAVRKEATGALNAIADRQMKK